MKKQITSKLHLSKETLRHLSERDLQNAVGGVVTNPCPDTGPSNCQSCPSESCISGACTSFGIHCC